MNISSGNSSGNNNNNNNNNSNNSSGNKSTNSKVLRLVNNHNNELSYSSLNIDELIRAAKYREVYEIYEYKELEYAANQFNNIVNVKDIDTLYGAMMITAALNEEIVNSKFVWKRVNPEIKKKTAWLKGLWKSLQFLFKKEYAGFFQEIESLVNDKSKLPPQIAILTEALRDRIRSNQYQLINEAYTTISIDRASSLLGLNKTSLPNYSKEKGWTYDEKANLITTATNKAKTLDLGTDTIILEKLTRIVNHLELE